jgi:arabinofuranosyltransferase
MMQETGTPTWGRRGPLVLVTGVVFALLVGKTAWLADDALITLRVAANWLQGFGPVWNTGERVQVYTHPLWLLVLTAAGGVTQEFYFTTLALSLALAVATFVLVVGRIAVDPVSAAFGAALLLLSKGFVDYSTSGLENVLTHLLLAVFLALYVAAPRTLRRAFWLAVVAALGSVNRLDTLLLYAPALAYTLFTLRGARLRALLALAAGFAPLLLWELFALVYYGFPFPNTYYAKLNTGIPPVEMVQQGLLYLLHSFGLEPLTVVTLGAGIAIPWLRRDWRLAAVAAGILLYLLYVVRIGGDFMSGRYLTAPFLAAVVILVRQPLAGLKTPALAALFAGTILLGFANPAHAPWFSTAAYDFRDTDNKGIEDERGYYYQRYGLLPASRTNRLAVGGQIVGVPDPQNRVDTMMGIIGLTASPYTQIVDILALTDPLLARLPAVHIPQWVHGHFFRRIPDGYLDTLRAGRNRIVDPQVAELYDRLARVTQGPLFAPARWTEIWRFATGQNDALVEPMTWRYPELETRPWRDFDRNWADQLAYDEEHGADALRGVALGAAGGVRVDLGELRHDRLLDLGFGASRFEIVYGDGETEVGRQTVSQSPLQLGDDLFTLVDVPAEVAARGYAELLILPLLPEALQLERVALFAGADGTDGTARTDPGPIHVADLLRQYYFTFYRGERGDREARLADLLARIQAAPAEEWATVPGGYKLDLLKMPAPEIQELVAAHSPEAPTLSDARDRPLLRYWGFLPDPPAEGEAGPSGLQGRLAFEVLAPFAEDYALWFHIANDETGAEYMVYDLTAVPGTTEWPVGAVYEAPVFLELEPGKFDVSFGLWTPERRRLYVDRGQDVYWINLPEQKVTAGVE